MLLLLPLKFLKISAIQKVPHLACRRHLNNLFIFLLDTISNFSSTFISSSAFTYVGSIISFTAESREEIFINLLLIWTNIMIQYQSLHWHWKTLDLSFSFLLWYRTISWSVRRFVLLFHLHLLMQWHILIPLPLSKSIDFLGSKGSCDFCKGFLLFWIGRLLSMTLHYRSIFCE